MERLPTRRTRITGFNLPLVPDWTANVGITWVHPDQIRVSLVENLIGPRDGDLAGTDLDTVATTDITATWEPLERHLALGASVLNIFDEDYELAKDPVGSPPSEPSLPPLRRGALLSLSAPLAMRRRHGDLPPPREVLVALVITAILGSLLVGAAGSAF